MSIVWIFGEARTSSTNFFKKVASHLNREYFDVVTPELIEDAFNVANPKKYVFFTHAFPLLERMAVYNDHLILIRCTRKDKAEQFLSQFCTSWVNQHLPDIDRFWNIESKDEFDRKSKILNSVEPTVFTKKQVFDYLGHCSTKDQYWNRIASDYNNATVFYEDLCSSGVHIPSINFSYKLTDDAFTIKLPSYKERLCLNHNMVRRWVDEYYNAQVVELVDTQR